MRVDAARTDCSQHNDSPLLIQTPAHTNTHYYPESVALCYTAVNTVSSYRCINYYLSWITSGILGAPGHCWASSPCQLPCRSPWCLALQAHAQNSSELFIWEQNPRFSLVSQSRPFRIIYDQIKYTTNFKKKKSKVLIVYVDFYEPILYVTGCVWLHCVIHRGAPNVSISWWCQRWVCPSACSSVCLWESECM